MPEFGQMPKYDMRCQWICWMTLHNPKSLEPVAPRIAQRPFSSIFFHFSSKEKFERMDLMAIPRSRRKRRHTLRLCQWSVVGSMAKAQQYTPNLNGCSIQIRTTVDRLGLPSDVWHRIYNPLSNQKLA